MLVHVRGRKSTNGTSPKRQFRPILFVVRAQVWRARIADVHRP
jgi:hypothetical protein